MSNWKETNLPCPIDGCSSSDGYAIDVKGNGWCFSCERSTWANDQEDVDQDLKMDYVEVRGIHPAIMKKYNTICSILGGEPAAMFTPYPSGGVKIRNLANKKFKTQGDMSSPMLFGMDIFSPQSFSSVTITEGELDAMSVFQMSRGQTACVSIRSSATVIADCKKNWDYLNSFDKIIVCVDMDEKGIATREKIVGLFDFKKVHVVHMSKYKDANAYLETGNEEDVKLFYKEWLSAKRYTPDAIISSFADIKAALDEERGEKLCDWPIEALNEKIKGIYAGDVIIIKGDEGLGKTELLRLIENHILETTNHPIGAAHLEENIDTTIQGVASYHLKRVMDISEGFTSKDEVLKGYMSAVKEDEGRMLLYNSFETGDERQFFDNVRFIVTVGGCRLFFFDHISWLATGTSDGEDERKKLDRISQKMKTMAIEMGFALIMVSHVNDDGQTRGSRNITKVADIVLHLTRDKTNENEEERNKMFIMVEKARKRGLESGSAKYIKYDPETTNLVDVLGVDVV